MGKALLLIDIQNIYFTEGPYHLDQPEAAAEVAARVLNEFRKEKLPVIYVKHLFHTEGYAENETYLNAINEQVAPVQGEKIIHKTCPNSFYETELLDYIKHENIEELVICGMMSHMCIDTTVRACKDHNLKVTVISNACTTKELTIDEVHLDAQTVHQAFMVGLNKMFANVIRYENDKNLGEIK